MIITVEETREHALDRFLWRHRSYVQSPAIVSAGMLTAGFLMRWHILQSEF